MLELPSVSGQGPPAPKGAQGGAVSDQTPSSFYAACHAIGLLEAGSRQRSARRGMVGDQKFDGIGGGSVESIRV